jgi:hypothetical protein
MARTGWIELSSIASCCCWVSWIMGSFSEDIVHPFRRVSNVIAMPEGFQLVFASAHNPEVVCPKAILATALRVLAASNKLASTGKY